MVISHNLADVFDVADRIIVLRLGKRVATFDVRDASQEDVVGAITGAEFGERGRERGRDMSENAQTPGVPAPQPAAPAPKQTAPASRPTTGREARCAASAG